MSEKIEVRPGQVWEDNDKRQTVRRKLLVLKVDGEHAHCRSAGGRKVRIRLSRFRPNSTGYALVADVP